MLRVLWQMLHRLDVCTTGVLVLARSEAAARHFTADMTAHRIRKQYKVTRPHGTGGACILAFLTDVHGRRSVLMVSA